MRKLLCNFIINSLIEIYKIITHLICIYYLSNILLSYCYYCIFSNYTNMYLIIYSLFKLYIGCYYNYNYKISYLMDMIFYIIYIFDLYIFNYFI